MNETILIVEDADSLRLHLVELLHRSGYKTLPAGDVPSAIEYLSYSSNIDLIISDYRLPSVDGHTWLKFLQKYFSREIKLGVMSAYPIDPDGVPFLRKPFSFEEFLDFVDSILCEPTFSEIEEKI